MNTFIFLPCVLYLVSPFWSPLFFLTILIQAGYIISRGFSLGRLPLVGLHDTLIFLAFSTALVSIPFTYSLKRQKFFRWAICILAFIFSIFGSFSHAITSPLPPIIKPIWFELHLILAFLSYGLFGVGAVIGIMCLSFPDEDAEPLQYNAIFTGFILFALSMIFGGIWAFLAWGTFWVWTPKELWSAMLWLALILYLHLRYIPWWKKGKGVIIAGMVNFLIMLFTYV